MTYQVLEEDKAILRAYGNTDLPESTLDRPIVTFALFSFNQEKCVREAVHGAFSQSYSPLEIILSDDCSSDRTFEVMEEMAREYCGPHLVKLRRGEVNLGTAQHVSAVAKASRGKLIFIAAGDDISEAHRCETIVRTWLAEGKPSCCLHSAASFFDDGNSIGNFVAAPTMSLNKRECLSFAISDARPFLSPTCVYTRDLFDSYEPLTGGSIIEDGVMALRSLATGRLISVCDALVRIRKSAETAGTGYSVFNPQRWNRFLLSRMISYVTMLRDLKRTDFDSKAKKRLQRIYRRRILRLSWLFLSEPEALPIAHRTSFFFKYVLFYPTPVRLMIKCADAARISGFSNTSGFRLAYWFFRGRHN